MRRKRRKGADWDIVYEGERMSTSGPSGGKTGKRNA